MAEGDTLNIDRIISVLLEGMLQIKQLLNNEYCNFKLMWKISPDNDSESVPLQVKS